MNKVTSTNVFLMSDVCGIMCLPAPSNTLLCTFRIMWARYMTQESPTTLSAIIFPKAWKPKKLWTSILPYLEVILGRVSFYPNFFASCPRSHPKDPSPVLAPNNECSEINACYSDVWTTRCYVPSNTLKRDILCLSTCEGELYNPKNIHNICNHFFYPNLKNPKNGL